MDIMNVAAAAPRPPAFSEDTEMHDLLLMAAQSHLKKADELFARFLKGVREGHFCACHVLEAVRKARKAILDQHDPDMAGMEDNLTLVGQVVRMGVLTLDLAWRANTQQQLHGCKNWTRVLFAAAALVNLWVPGLPQSPTPCKSPAQQRWVVSLMKTPTLCPNRLLRLELLRFVAMWQPTTLAADAELCRMTAVGVILNLFNLTPARLLPLDRVGLLWPLAKVLYDLHEADFLSVLTVRSTKNIPLLQVGPTERALAHVVHLMGHAAFRLHKMRRKGLLSLPATLDQFENLMLLLRLMLTVPPHLELYEAPGMCQIAAGAIAAAAHCIVGIRGASATENGTFQNLLSLLDDFFLHLASNENSGAVRREIRRHHGRCLARVAVKMEDFGFPVLFVPRLVPAPKRTPPNEFLDRRTRRLMEDPVRLEATGSVVDRSTLMVLLLVGNLEQDLTFTPLPELRDNIKAWREGSRRKAEDGP